MAEAFRIKGRRAAKLEIIHPKVRMVELKPGPCSVPVCMWECVCHCMDLESPLVAGMACILRLLFCRIFACCCVMS